MTQERKIGDVIFRAKRPLGPCHECDAHVNNEWCRTLNGAGEKWRPCATTWEIANPKPTGIEALVCDDLARLQIKGRSAPPHVSGNVRDELQSSYHIALRMAVTLRKAIADIDNPPTNPNT